MFFGKASFCRKKRLFDKLPLGWFKDMIYLPFVWFKDMIYLCQNYLFFYLQINSFIYSFFLKKMV